MYIYSIFVIHRAIGHHFNASHKTKINIEFEINQYTKQNVHFALVLKVFIYVGGEWVESQVVYLSSHLRTI